MTTDDRPQIYLITPPQFDLLPFADHVARVLDSAEVACLRLAMSSTDQDTISRAADHLRTMCHERDVAIVIADHYRLVTGLGLDGCHLDGSPKTMRDARKDLGADAIIGAHCGTSRHAGMNAAEAGADYVSFGPIGASALGDGTTANREIFELWSETIELPVIAEGSLTASDIETFAPVVDFFGIGDEIWSSDDPAHALLALANSY